MKQLGTEFGEFLKLTFGAERGKQVRSVDEGANQYGKERSSETSARISCSKEGTPLIELEPLGSEEALDAESPMIDGNGSTAFWLNQTRTLFSATAWSSFVRDNRPQLLYYGGEKVVRIDPDVWGDADEWHVMGDIHGDFYALFGCIRYLVEREKPFKLILLGDLVDRGPHPLECLWLILYLVDRYPGRVLWIAGNHDIGIHERPDRSFGSSVMPAEFVDELNMVDAWTPFRRQFGREYIELVKDLPRAALAPDGTLFTHGGFPLVDLHADLEGRTTLEEKVEWLNSEKALQDFTWTRITRYPRRIPNRHSTGSSYGFKDFAAFCEAVKDFFPARRLVNGHEHPDGGVDVHSSWQEHPALTLSGFGFDASQYGSASGFTENYRKTLTLARCRADDIPELVHIDVDTADLADFFEKELAWRFKPSAAE